MAALVLLWTGNTLVRSAFSRSRQSYEGRLREQEVLNRLLIQQLDEVFDSTINGVDTQQELSETQERLLRTWIRYDLQFLTASRKQAQSSFLRAETHIRLGESNYLLREDTDCLKHLQAAIDLLTAMMSRPQSQEMVVGELLDAHLLAATCAERLNDRATALKHLESMQTILQNEQAPSDDAQKLLRHVTERIAELTGQLPVSK